MDLISFNIASTYINTTKSLNIASYVKVPNISTTAIYLALKNNYRSGSATSPLKTAN